MQQTRRGEGEKKKKKKEKKKREREREREVRGACGGGALRIHAPILLCAEKHVLVSKIVPLHTHRHASFTHINSHSPQQTHIIHTHQFTFPQIDRERAKSKEQRAKSSEGVEGKGGCVVTALRGCRL